MFTLGDMGSVDDDGWIFLADRATNMIILSEFQGRSGPVLDEFVNKHGVQVRRLSDEQLKKIGETTGEVIAELITQDALSKKVFTSLNRFRSEQKAYSTTTELDFLQARNLDFKWPA